MASLLSKARVFVLGNLHTLLDAAIDLNSIAAVKQNIRDLESARDGISAQFATATGRVNSLKANIANLEKEIVTNNSNIDLLLGDDDPSNDANALTIQLTVNGLKQRMEAQQEDLTIAEEMQVSMQSALQKIRQRHSEMLSRVTTLEQQDRAAKANEEAAGALEKVASLSNLDSAASVDNAEQRIRDRSATAKARLDQAFGNLSSGTDDSVALAQAKKDLETRRAALKPTEKSAAA